MSLNAATITPPLRVVRRYRQTIAATPERVFPLLCPVREKEWLPGWESRMLYSVSGVAEPGAVFLTRDAQGSTYWLITEHQPARRVAFARFQPDGLVVRCEIDLAPLPEGRSAVTVVYTYTAVEPRGEKALAQLTEEAWGKLQTFWENSMNQWLLAHPE